jgi:hypothetical protein
MFTQRFLISAIVLLAVVAAASAKTCLSILCTAPLSMPDVDHGFNNGFAENAHAPPLSYDASPSECLSSESPCGSNPSEAASLRAVTAAAIPVIAPGVHLDHTSDPRIGYTPLRPAPAPGVICFGGDANRGAVRTMSTASSDACDSVFPANITSASAPFWVSVRWN